MHTEKATQIMEILIAMCEVYGKDFSKPSLRFYVEAIGDLPIDKIREAALHIVNTRKYTKFPMPAEFREFIVPPQLIEVEANKAWREIEDAMVMYGYVRSVCFKDAAITQTILGMGGWAEFCNRSRAEGEDYVWLQKEFEKRYAMYRQSKVAENQILVGWSDAENIRQGFQKEPKDIAYIGFDKGEVPQIGWTNKKAENTDGFKSIASVVAQEE